MGCCFLKENPIQLNCTLSTWFSLGLMMMRPTALLVLGSTSIPPRSNSLCSTLCCSLIGYILIFWFLMVLIPDWLWSFGLAVLSVRFHQIPFLALFMFLILTKLGFKRHCTLKNNQLGNLQLDIFLALASDPAVNFWRSQTQLPDLQDLVPGQSESKSHSGHLPVLRSQLCESKYFHEEKKN